MILKCLHICGDLLQNIGYGVHGGDRYIPVEL